TAAPSGPPVHDAHEVQPGGSVPAGADAISDRSNSRTSSRRPSATRVTSSRNAHQTRPSGAVRRQPRYPSAGGAGRSPTHAGSRSHKSARRAPSTGGTGHAGSGRPENTDALAIQPDSSVDLDVTMQDDHEGAEVHIGTPIGRTRVGDQVAAVVPVGC